MWTPGNLGESVEGGISHDAWMRRCLVLAGWFMSVDTLGGLRSAPQSWNRYAANLKGITLPTNATGGDAQVTSTTPGVMQVHVDLSLSASEQAPVVAAELAGHVVPGLLGQGASAADEEHHDREDPAVQAARRTVSSRTHRTSRGVVSLAAAYLTAALFSSLSATAAAAATNPGHGPDRITLHSSSSFSLQELSIDFRSQITARLQVCDSVDRFRKCSTAWKTTERRLSAREVKDLKSLSREADLFTGNMSGGQLDLAFRWLEVHAGSEVAMLVTSLNNSFSEPGPRKELLTRLKALEKELGASAPHNAH